MTIKPIKTEWDYQKRLKRLKSFGAKPNTAKIKQKCADIIRKTNDGKSLIVAIAIEKCSRYLAHEISIGGRLRISCGSTSIVNPQARPTRSPRETHQR